MPFEARKRMTWGPGKDPVSLEAGDEVPAPVKRVLLQNGYVVQVDQVAGKKWSQQPEEAQSRWAESQGLSYVTQVHNDENGSKEVTVKATTAKSRLAHDVKELEPKRRQRPLPAEVVHAAHAEPQRVTGDEVVAKSPVALTSEEDTPKPKKIGKKRGRKPRS